MNIELRDYFAAKVISNILNAETDDFKMLHGKNDEKSMFINAAKIAYKLADAMIEVRKISKIE